MTATEKNTKWILSYRAFSTLLSSLAADPDSAAARYEALRVRLIGFFGWERCAEAPDLADEVLNRLARRLAEGEQVEVIERYACGIARLVLREAAARTQRTTAATAELQRRAPESSPDLESDSRFLCFSGLSTEERHFILEYYTGDGRQRIENRRKIARRLNLPLNTVRNRARRLRERLERSSR